MLFVPYSKTCLVMIHCTVSTQNLGIYRYDLKQSKESLSTTPCSIYWMFWLGVLEKLPDVDGSCSQIRNTAIDMMQQSTVLPTVGAAQYSYFNKKVIVCFQHFLFVCRISQGFVVFWWKVKQSANNIRIFPYFHSFHKSYCIWMTKKPLRGMLMLILIQNQILSRYCCCYYYNSKNLFIW